MMKDKEALAVVVGEAWAQRMLDKRLSEGAKVGGSWPGRAEDVANVCKGVPDVAAPKPDSIPAPPVKPPPTSPPAL